MKSELVKGVLYKFHYIFFADIDDPVIGKDVHLI